MSSADIHFCYPKYTQDEWDGAQDEIERLKEENAHFAWRDKDKNQLIIDLGDAYAATRGDGDITKKLELLKRAREATKDE